MSFVVLTFSRQFGLTAWIENFTCSCTQDPSLWFTHQLRAKSNMRCNVRCQHNKCLMHIHASICMGFECSFYLYVLYSSYMCHWRLSGQQTHKKWQDVETSPYIGKIQILQLHNVDIWFLGLAFQNPAWVWIISNFWRQLKFSKVEWIVAIW